MSISDNDDFFADIQKQPGINEVDIDKVGVCDVCYPIVVLDKKNKKQSTVAKVNMYVDLPHQFRGTHMSRFIEILNQHRGEITVRNIGAVLEKMILMLEAKCAHIELAFQYFIEKAAPVSQSSSLMNYNCRFLASCIQGGEEDFVLEVTVPVMTLCPCSKAISDTAAHNQRSEITVRVRFEDFLWIEDLIAIVESSASSELFSLLKREDEKYVAEHAYNNPRFVEDVVRIVSAKLLKDDRISWFYVKSKNYESIHNFNVYACVEKDKRPRVTSSSAH